MSTKRNMMEGGANFIEKIKSAFPKKCLLFLYFRFTMLSVPRLGNSLPAHAILELLEI